MDKEKSLNSANYQPDAESLRPEGVSRRIGQAVERDHENQEAKKRLQRERKIGTTVASHMRPIAQTLSLDMFDKPAFRSVYSEKEIQRDREYVEETERRIQKKRLREHGTTEPSPLEELADDFEVMVLYGIQRNAWLGNTVDEKGNIPFKTYTSGTTKYDDYKHRVDAFTTVELTEPVQDEETGASLVRFHMGFDATLSGNRDTIDEKIMRCQNDPSLRVPFGFTQVKYYANTEKGIVEKVDLVPRFTLAINKEMAQGLKESARTQRNEKGRLENINFSSGLSERVRFMMLSEIKAQTQLYYAMLPDEPEDGSAPDPVVVAARAQLEQIDKTMTQAMRECAKTFGKSWTEVERDFITKRSSAEIASGDEKVGQYGDPYVLMVARCRELMDEAYNGNYDGDREISDHTHKKLGLKQERAAA